MTAVRAPKLFTTFTNLSLLPDQLDPLLSGDHPLPADIHPMRTITAGLGEVLGLSQDEIARLLGISRSTALKPTPPSSDVLDRLYMLSQRLELMQDVLGEHADGWFVQANDALDGRRPIDLLRTRKGQAQLDDVIQALLDGNFY